MFDLQFIELDKMKVSSERNDDDILTLWVLFMNATSMQGMKAIAKRDPAIEIACSIAEELAMNEQARLEYEARETFL